MQSHEERAEEMLRDMDGELSVPMQQTVLRRMILAEDAVVEYQGLVQRLNENIEYLLVERQQTQAEAEQYRATLEQVQVQLLETRAGLEAIAYDTVVPGWIREIAHDALVSSDPGQAEACPHSPLRCAWPAGVADGGRGVKPCRKLWGHEGHCEPIEDADVLDN